MKPSPSLHRDSPILPAHAPATGGWRTEARPARAGGVEPLREELRRRVSSAKFRALRTVGAVSRAARSRRRQDSLLILCYHGISIADEHEWLPQLYITPEQFRSRLQFLRDAKAAVLPFEEALVRLKRGDLPARSVTITFDDGFYDFLLHGVPMLTEFGFPSTLYLTTHYSDYRMPIIGLVLDYILWKSGRRQLPVLEQGGHSRPMTIRNYSERQIVVQLLLQWMEQRDLSTEEKNGFARLLAEQLGIDYDAILERRILQIMSAEEVRKTAAAGVDIQLHTHRHRTPRDRALFQREIEENQRRILELTGKAAAHFCYPSGDYAPEFFAWLKECGVKTATTCDSGLAEPTSGVMKLPRVLDHGGWDLLRFESAVAGLLV